MAIIFTPNPATDIETSIGGSIDVDITAEDDELVLPKILTNITLSSVSTYYGLSLTNGLTANISGTFLTDLFDHLVSYVANGSSDLIETPTIQHILLIPDYKEVFKINPDLDDPKVITVDATAHWDDLSTDTVTYTINIANDLAYLGTWIQDYIANRYEVP